MRNSTAVKYRHVRVIEDVTAADSTDRILFIYARFYFFYLLYKISIYLRNNPAALFRSSSTQLFTFLNKKFFF